MTGVWFRVLRQAAVLLLLAVPAAVLTGVFHSDPPVWAEPPLGPGEVRLEMALGWKEALWLDARSRGEFESGHVPGAMLLNEDEWEGLFLDVMMVWEPDRPVVVYCGGAQCQASHAVAERLRRDLASEGIFVLRGGWNEWSKQGAKR